MTSPMILTGDDNVPAMPMTDAQVNHLRRLLAWMRTEWMLDEDSQRGYLKGTAHALAFGVDAERVNAVVQEGVDQVNSVPQYVRQAVKMLTKALREHEAASGVVEGST